jgi:hypothetical protein
MNQFIHARRKLSQSILIPLVSTILLVFVVLYTTITTIGISDYQSQVESTIERKINYFNLTISLQVSSNSTITNSNDVIRYAQGESDLESNVRSLISQKVSQSPNLIGSQLYFMNSSREPVYSYSVSGIPSQSQLFSDPIIVDFIANNSPYIFTIRHDNIANNYNFVQYQKSYGLFTLFEKVEDEEHNLVAILASDYSNQKLYQEIFDFTYQANFDGGRIQVSNGSDFLRLNEKDMQIASDFTLGRQQKSLNKAIYNYQLSDHVYLVSELDLTMPIVQNVTLLIYLFIITLLLTGLTVILVRYTVRKIINPLEAINQNIRKTLEY